MKCLLLILLLLFTYSLFSQSTVRYKSVTAKYVPHIKEQISQDRLVDVEWYWRSDSTHKVYQHNKETSVIKRYFIQKHTKLKDTSSVQNLNLEAFMALDDEGDSFLIMFGYDKVTKTLMGISITDGDEMYIYYVFPLLKSNKHYDGN